MSRQPALDGIRGTAIILVIAGHTGIGSYLNGGPAGVAAFFTLSGYLIGSLLLAERDETGVRVGAFYLRRARRLLPALFVLIAVLLAVGAVTATDALPPLFYVENLHRLVTGTVNDGALTHTWSLSIEEQFYLVFPLTLIVLSRRLNDRALLVVFTGLALVSAGWRLWLSVDGAGMWRPYFGTDTNACLLLAGVSLALAVRLTAWRPHALAAPVAFGALLARGFTGQTDTARAVVPLVASLLAVVLIASSPRWLTGRTLTLIGRRSYALYLWHWPLLLAWRMMGRDWAELVVCLVVLAGITALSWRYVEEPFLNRSALRVGGRDLDLALRTHDG